MICIESKHCHGLVSYKIVYEIVDTQDFRAWLRRETWWNRLVFESQKIIDMLERVYRMGLDDTLRATILEWKRQYDGKLFEDLCNTLKGGHKANKQRQKEQVILAATRTVYRYIPNDGTTT